eukprot:1160334-Pyramimonas_sp.AAC.2
MSAPLSHRSQHAGKGERRRRGWSRRRSRHTSHARKPNAILFSRDAQQTKRISPVLAAVVQLTPIMVAVRLSQISRLID